MSTCSQLQWSNLPSEILLKILSYLPLRDRISVCSTCRLWRSALFYPKFWKKVVLKFKSNDPNCNARSIFIGDNTIKYVKSCTLKFECVNNSSLIEVNNLLSLLKYNSQIEELILLPINCHKVLKWGWVDSLSSGNQIDFISGLSSMVINQGRPCHSYNVEYLNNNEILNDNEIISTGKRHNFNQYSHKFIESAYECLQGIISGSRGLHTLVLGCLQGLTDMADDILPLLEKHSYTLSTLAIASVKQDPNSYPILHITPSHFVPFTRLQVLTVDYDYVNDHLLEVMSRSGNIPLMRLVIHIHGIEPTHRGTSDLAWHNFTSVNPQCSLVINLLHSYEGVEQLNLGLLRPSMPLTTFRALFCDWINLPALRLIADWYSDSLQHLQLVDALDHRSWAVLQAGREDMPFGPDPLVMLAWKCKRLKHLTLIGYSYNGSDLVAIARLRGDSDLEELIFPEECLGLDYPINHHFHGNDMESIIQDVSVALTRPWRPLKVTELHASLRSVDFADSIDEYILPFLLNDSLPISQ